MKILLIVITVLCLISDAKAQDSETISHGPEDCLIDVPGSCPLDFLEQAICYRDENVCYDLRRPNRPENMDAFRFSESKLLQGYGEQLFPDLSETEAFFFFSTNDEAAIHEVFEYAICLISPDSCYEVGEAGLSIYNPFVGSDCGPDIPYELCNGGPTDSAICQVTPEVCSASSAE